MQRCEDCQFIRLGDQEDLRRYYFAKCKASEDRDKEMQVVSREYDNPKELFCSTVRHGEYTCERYLEKEHE